MSSAGKTYAIVVALDYSEASELALDEAFELCAARELATLHVVHVMPMIPPAMAEVMPVAMGATAPLLEQAAAELKAHVERRVSAFNEAHPGQELSATRHRIATHECLSAPAEAIAQLASDVSADLVIVGTHGRRGVSRLVLGSVAEGVVRSAPCPVMVMRKIPPRFHALACR
jgi:nucleotide-binding universal stress UspA family protein